jgi:hypothetical protein
MSSAMTSSGSNSAADTEKWLQWTVFFVSFDFLF